MGVKKTQKQFIQEATVAKPHFDYSEFVYKSYHVKGVVKCTKHSNIDGGRFLISPCKILDDNIIGCPHCAKESQRSKMAKSNEQFKLEVLERFPHYDVSDVEYKNSTTRVNIRCPIHGVFKISPVSIIEGNHGCQKCGAESRLENASGWSRTDYINRSNGRNSNLYLIRCFNDQEDFYKIGITYKDVKDRYRSGNMPYKYDIVSVISLSPNQAWDIERNYHTKLKKYKYKPQLKFDGSKLECYTLDVLKEIKFGEII